MVNKRERKQSCDQHLNASRYNEFIQLCELSFSLRNTNFDGQTMPNRQTVWLNELFALSAHTASLKGVESMTIDFE